MKNMISSILIGLLIVNTIFISSAIGNEELIDKKMVKVYIESHDDVDTLSNLGLEIYVIEQNYLAIRITDEEEQELERIGFSVTSIKEDELVHRIVKVVIKNQEDINELANLGLDIWEVNPGYLIAMVYDKHIIEIKEKGFVVEILYESEKDFQKSFFDPVQAISQAGVSYHSYSSLKTDLQNLENNYPNIAKVYDIGDSWEKTQGIAGRDILAIKISDNVANEEDDEPDILFMGGTHAREWISVEVPFYLAKYLLEHYSTDQKVKQLVDSKEIWIVPLVNPDGFEYSRTDERLWRKNRRDNGDGTFGVDINRNFGYIWGQQGSSGDSASNTYRGTAPFSEPETQAIRNLVSSPVHNFISSISYHSYSQLILYPWGYTKDASSHKAPLSKMADDMADEIKKVHGKTYKPQQSFDLYITSGSSDDWLYGAYSIAAFTIELRPKNKWDNWFRPFELPEDQIIPTWEENKPAALYLIEWFQQLDILSPTESAIRNVGSHNNPSKTNIEVEIKTSDGMFIQGLTKKSDYTVKIGDKIANILNIVEKSDRYVLEVMPPTQDADGLYDLDINVCFGRLSDAETNAINYGAKGVDMALIIDSSGSMGWNDPSDYRKDAAKQFVALSNTGDQICVADFGHSSCDSRLLLQLLEIIDESSRDTIKAAIDQVVSNGATPIGYGLQRGYNELSSSRAVAGHSKAGILLTDGFDTCGTEGTARIYAQNFGNKGWFLYTIGLTGGADEALLNELATLGNGEYAGKAPSSDKLAEIYRAISGRVLGEQTTTTVKGTAQQSQTSIENALMDSSITRAKFVISWAGSDLDLTLESPDGSIIDPSVAVIDPNIDYTSAPSYEFYAVNSPMAGEWKLRIFGTDVPIEGEDYSGSVMAVTDVTMNMYLDRDKYAAGEPIKVSVSISDATQPITGASVIVDVESPSTTTSSSAQTLAGKDILTEEEKSELVSLRSTSLETASFSPHDQITLLDDGMHGDGMANDGVYANFYTNTNIEGTYKFAVKGSGVTNTGEEFTRETEKSTYASGAPTPKISVTPTNWEIELERDISAEKNFTVKSSVDTIASISATDLTNEYGDVIPSTSFSFYPSVLSLSADEPLNFTANLTIPLSSPAGNYTGSIIITAPEGTLNVYITLTVEEVIPATIDFDPDTLNKKSKGKWVTVYTELPEGYDVGEIDVGTIILNEEVQAELKPTGVGDYDSDGVPDLMVKFDWQEVSDILPIGDEVEITITGELYDGSLFKGSDTIRVINEG